MDLKRLIVKKEIADIVGRMCPVRDYYNGAINVGEVLAIIGIPSQTFELFAQSEPKIYKSELDIKVDILGNKMHEVEVVAQEINQEILKKFTSMDLLNIQMLHNFESDVKVNGIRLSYVFNTHVEQE